jgi:hypothetical protein
MAVLLTCSLLADEGGVGQLNRPEGLVFGPDGKLYITSFRADTSDRDSIRIYDSAGQFLDKIKLDDPGANPPSFAAALLFGPDGKLFVPIYTTSDLPNSTGELRSYDIANINLPPTVYSLSPLSDGAELIAPWYLTFESTDPHTLNYGD